MYLLWHRRVYCFGRPNRRLLSRSQKSNPLACYEPYEKRGGGKFFTIRQVDDDIFFSNFMSCPAVAVITAFSSCSFAEAGWFQKNLCTVSCMGRLFRIFFQPGSERSGKQCYYKHNGKGNNIVRIVKMECQSRSGKKKLKTSTLTTEVRIPHSRLVVITAVTSTPNM